MTTPNTTKAEMQQTLNRLAEDLPPDRLAQVVDFALFMKTLAAQEQRHTRTPEQLQAINQLLAGPKHTGLYDALMRDRADERRRE